MTTPHAPLTIWCNVALKPPDLAALRAGLDGHRLLYPDAAGTRPPLDEADIAFGQPDPELCVAQPRLRWIHVSTAGYTAFDRAAIRAALSARGTPLTTSSTVYSEPCAQHLLAFMLAEARQLGQSVRHQVGDHAWSQAGTRGSCALLGGETVALVGYGAIARRLAQLLAPFGLDVVGVRREPRGDESIPIVPVAQIDQLLGRAHHVIDMLPANGESNRFFDRARLGAIRRGAVFYNIGRGTTVDQDALVDALRAGQLRAAYLDVTDPEPLPPEHPLWAEPGCTITPHAAGGHHDEKARIVRHFLANFARHLAGQPLLDRVA
jgi:phosphoglycerate dehydrogenase-like enzyme